MADGDRYVSLSLRGNWRKSGVEELAGTIEWLQSSSDSRRPSQQQSKGLLTDTKRGLAGRKAQVALPSGELKRAASARRSRSWSEPIQFETAHYHIVSLASPTEVVKLGRHLELFYQEMKQMLPLPGDPKVKLLVYLAADQKGFVGLAKTFFHGQVHNNSTGVTAGFYSKFQRALFTAAKTKSSAKTSGYVLVTHEGTHQYLHQLGYQGGNGWGSSIPTWLDEGLAVFFENGSTHSGKFVWRAPTKRLLICRHYYQQHGKNRDAHCHCLPPSYVVCTFISTVKYTSCCTTCSKTVVVWPS